MSLGFLILGVVLGLVAFGVGLRNLTNAISQRVKFGSGELALGTGPFVMLIGLVLIFGSPYAHAQGYFGVSNSTVEAEPIPSALVPSAPTTHRSQSSEPPQETDTVFLSPRGRVYCATFPGEDLMGCVVKIHKYGPQDPNCYYLDTLSRTGPTVVKSCASRQEVERMYRSPPSDDSRLRDYGNVGVGPATCEVNHDYVACYNEVGRGFKVSGSANVLR